MQAPEISPAPLQGSGYTEIPRAGGLDAFREPDVRPADLGGHGSGEQPAEPAESAASGRQGLFGFDVTPEDIAEAHAAEERYRSSGLANSPFSAAPEAEESRNEREAPAAASAPQPAPAPQAPGALPMHHESPNSWGPLPGMDLLNPLTEHH